MSDAVVYPLFASVGTAILLYGFVQLRRARGSAHWPMVEAVIVDVGVKENRGCGAMCVPVVRYEYTCEEVAYQGDQIMFTGLALSAPREDIERFLEPFAKGDRIGVHVCPTNPRLSVIQPGVDSRLTLLFFIGAFLLLSGGGGLLGWWSPGTLEPVERASLSCDAESPRDRCETRVARAGTPRS